MKTVITTADDFGLTETVNAAVDQAHRRGCLHAASLMVAGAAATDAVRIAKANPNLRVGLHLVVIEGPAEQLPSAIPGLVDRSGQFPSNQLMLGINYCFRPSIRRQLESEIRAQFEAFARTGLVLDHVNAHKHMHLHPMVGAMMLRIGREFGLTRLRVPAEPPAVMRACGEPVSVGATAMFVWTRLLRHQAARAGVAVNDHCFGVAWSGHMTAVRVRRLLARLPDGDSELYFHPATGRDPVIARLMPDYEHASELAALVEPDIVAAVKALNQPP
jgi:hopanoid biosynthesis associated protein HpnK